MPAIPLDCTPGRAPGVFDVCSQAAELFVCTALQAHDSASKQEEVAVWEDERRESK